MKISKDQIVKLSPPWNTYHNKVLALFGRDPEVTVRDLQSRDDYNFGYFILVNSNAKAQAIKTLLKNPVDIGNVTVTAYIYGPDENLAEEKANADGLWAVEAAFEGNPVFEKAVAAGSSFFDSCFCVFKKEVIQFWNDDLTDLYGNCSTLAQDIAKEILNDNGVDYCTNIE